MALAWRDEYETGLERGAPAPKTASRAERLRGTRTSKCREGAGALESKAVGYAYERWLLRRAREAERWIASNSSRLRPEPTATQVSGLSARCTGIWVS